MGGREAQQHYHNPLGRYLNSLQSGFHCLLQREPLGFPDGEGPEGEGLLIDHAVFFPSSEHTNFLSGGGGGGGGGGGANGPGNVHHTVALATKVCI